MRYEVPELSQRLGVYVTFPNRYDAFRAAEQAGCDAVWEVEMKLATPLLNGRIWAFTEDGWLLVDPSSPCRHH